MAKVARRPEYGLDIAYLDRSDLVLVKWRDDESVFIGHRDLRDGGLRRMKHPQFASAESFAAFVRLADDFEAATTS